MRFSTLSVAALLPLLALADSSTTSLTTTITSTQTLTKTITVSQVVASVTSTYGLNSTATYAPTGTGSTIIHPAATTAESSTATSTVKPANFMGAAPSLNAMYAGSAGLLAMIAAALL